MATIISFIDTISHWLWLKQGSWRHNFFYIYLPSQRSWSKYKYKKKYRHKFKCKLKYKGWQREDERREPNYNPWVTPGNPGTQCGLYCFEPGLNHRHLNELDCPQLNWITRICSPKKFLFRLYFPFALLTIHPNILSTSTYRNAWEKYLPSNELGCPHLNWITRICSPRESPFPVRFLCLLCWQSI